MLQPWACHIPIYLTYLKSSEISDLTVWMSDVNDGYEWSEMLLNVDSGREMVDEYARCK